MFIFFILYTTVNILIFTSGEYHIKESIPSYLYHKFSNIKEEIFPFDIRINISLSRILGTLLYSIDRNMNQLILTLSDIKEPTMKIEFRKEEYYVNISQLCGCGKCKYGIIDLRIQIQFNISLQCNGRDFQNFKYVENKGINDVYPLPYDKMDTNKTLLNEAQLWLINHQRYKDVYSNPKQLLGCIFNVWYKDELIKFTNITDNIGRKCTKICIGDVCNGGHCYETYNGKPVCDCTNTFFNGPYCNNTTVPVNIRSLSQNFKFNMLKVSWRSFSKNLLSLNNSNIQIHLYSEDIRGLGSILVLEYKYLKECCIVIKGTLSETYISNKEYILLIYFLETTIDIKLFNGSWLHRIIHTNLDIRKEVFTSVTLRSGYGYIDFYHKTSLQEYTWRKVYIENVEQLKIDQNVSISNEKVEEKTYNIKYIIVIILLIVFLIVSILFNIRSYYMSRQKAINFIFKDIFKERKGMFKILKMTEEITKQKNDIVQPGNQDGSGGENSNLLGSNNVTTNV